LAPALALLAEWKESTDSLTTTKIAKAVAAQQASYDLAQQATRITWLDQANANQRRWLWTLGIGVHLLLALLVLAATQYQALRRSNEQLARNSWEIQKNHDQMAEQSARLAILLREVHHRVKNNLAMVASLLRLQAARLTDPEALRAMRESQQRIEAISLVHQGLYQTADVTSVDMRRYITDLVQLLCTTHKTSVAAVELQLDLASVHLNVDVAVPLGLLLNELVINAFKHAYAEAEMPTLRVALSPDATGNLLLEVQDNGSGFDPAVQSHSGFGRRLVTALVKQLAGKLSLLVTEGTHYRLLLPVASLNAEAVG
jgi:two-component sensor histidine kinase